ncbi:eukaryotic elongation factor 2 kinase-like [Penaeus japonicus]|uniref:eukaryotic elongation factor 2 kinase-like n=1 Tax=Penaeus japonicus TaxID=27405 RepID=UPI001C715F8C|nr:eukaryotic elongation factor 2 kinase-like [Penaeus japonicus]
MAERQGAPGFGETGREYKRQAAMSKSLEQTALKNAKADKDQKTMVTSYGLKGSENSQPDEEFKGLIAACEADDRRAMIKVAKAFHTGDGLPPSRDKNWGKALYWLEKAVRTRYEVDESSSPLDDPCCKLVAMQASLYYTGGPGLAKDVKKSGELFKLAAELATKDNRGDLASEYSKQSKEAWQTLNKAVKKRK